MHCVFSTNNDVNDHEIVYNTVVTVMTGAALCHGEVMLYIVNKSWMHVFADFL